jgi:hypothetical protein
MKISGCSGSIQKPKFFDSYLVSFMGSSSGNLSLFTRCELSKVAMVISLPVARTLATFTGMGVL